MAKDFAQITTRKATSRHKGKNTDHAQLKPWAWLLSGVFLGVAMVLTVFFSQRFDVPSIPTDLAQATIEVPITTDKSESNKSKEVTKGPRFEFHQLLPKMEIPLPKIEREPLRVAPAPKETQTHAAKPASKSSQYFLQVGAFKHFHDADRRRGHLALLGLDADIIRVSTANGEQWHRVHIGPIEDPAKLATIQRRLQANQIESIALK